MGSISLSNIVVDGISFFSLDDISIKQTINDHAYASITGKLSFEDAQSYLDRMSGHNQVTIKTTAENQKSVLFCGFIQNIEKQDMDNYSQVTVTVVSFSKKLDFKKVNKTYQEVSKTYGDIITEVVSQYGSVTINVADKATGSFIFQHEETDWEFIKRMASNIKAQLLVDCTSASPSIAVGVPSGAKTHSDSMVKTSSSISQDNSSESKLWSNEYGIIGENFSTGSGNEVIACVISDFSDGVLKSQYSLQPKSQLAVDSPITNQSFGGCMFKGEVQEVQNDKVKVHFVDIDQGYNSASDMWFPYSTVYSSSDGSGFYCMPEVGDMVRVMMPSGNEKDAFVCGSVNSNPLDKPRDKAWKAPGGKEILLTDEGLFIICDEDKIFINMSSENGIEIKSTKPICFTSDSDISINAGGKIEMKAKNSMNLQVGEASIELSGDNLTMGANKIYLN